MPTEETKLKDYEYDFCLTLHAKLKERIKGKIHTTVKDDVLHVAIYMGSLSYAIAFDDFSGKFVEGVSADNYVEIIVKKYRKFVIENSLGRYFYN